MFAVIFLVAGACILVVEALEPNSPVANLVLAAWLLAPYLVLNAVMIREKNTSLLATAVATLLGAAGALASVIVLTMLDSGFDGMAARLIPMYQAGAIAVLVPSYRWLVGISR